MAESLRGLLFHAPGAVFVSYRIEDTSPDVAWLVRSLQNSFGKKAVFHDKISLRGSQDWPRAVESAVARCKVMLVVMGPKWESVVFPPGHERAGQPRLSDPNDWVRKEIVQALALGRPVVPLLIGRDLPVTQTTLDGFGMGDLARVQVRHFRHGDLSDDYAALEEALQSVGGLRSRAVQRAVYGALIVGLTMFASLVLGIGLSQTRSPPRQLPAQLGGDLDAHIEAEADAGRPDAPHPGALVDEDASADVLDAGRRRPRDAGPRRLLCAFDVQLAGQAPYEGTPIAVVSDSACERHCTLSRTRRNCRILRQ
jgi:hypothetical protein